MPDTTPIPQPVPEGGEPGPAAPPTTSATVATTASRHRGRTITSWVLVVLILIVTPLALASGWARLILANEKAYIAAVSPLAGDATVQQAIENKVTDAVMTQVEALDLDQTVITWLDGFERMPPKVLTAVQALMTSMNQGLENVVRNAVTKVVTAPKFTELWENLHAKLHQQFVAIMDGTSVLLTDEGGLALQLQPVLAAVRQQMVDNGRAWAANIPDSTLQYELLSPEATKTLQTYYNLATNAFWVILGVWVVLALLAVLLALDRPRAVARVAMATVLGSLLLAVILRVAENQLVAAGNDPQQAGVINAIINDVLTGLRDGIRIAAVGMLFVALVAWLFSRAPLAVAARRGLGRLWGPDADDHAVLVRRIVAGAVAVVVGLVVLFADLSTAWTVLLGIVLLAAVVLALLPGPRETVSEQPV